jgi:hypothetical protein
MAHGTKAPAVNLRRGPALITHRPTASIRGRIPQARRKSTTVIPTRGLPAADRGTASTADRIGPCRRGELQIVRLDEGHTHRRHARRRRALSGCPRLERPRAAARVQTAVAPATWLTYQRVHDLDEAQRRKRAAGRAPARSSRGPRPRPDCAGVDPPARPCRCWRNPRCPAADVATSDEPVMNSHRLADLGLRPPTAGRGRGGRYGAETGPRPLSTGVPVHAADHSLISSTAARRTTPVCLPQRLGDEDARRT